MECSLCHSGVDIIISMPSYCSANQGSNIDQGIQQAATLTDQPPFVAGDKWATQTRSAGLHTLILSQSIN